MLRASALSSSDSGLNGRSAYGASGTLLQAVRSTTGRCPAGWSRAWSRVRCAPSERRSVRGHNASDRDLVLTGHDTFVGLTSASGVGIRTLHGAGSERSDLPTHQPFEHLSDRVHLGRIAILVLQVGEVGRDEVEPLG